MEEPIIKETEQNQLTWYGHVKRIAEGRLPKTALKWMPKQRRVWGRPKKNSMEGIRKDMNERNLHEGQWEDRKQWSLGVGQRRTTFWNRQTHILIKYAKTITIYCTASSISFHSQQRKKKWTQRCGQFGTNCLAGCRKANSWPRYLGLISDNGEFQLKLQLLWPWL